MWAVKLPSLAPPVVQSVKFEADLLGQYLGAIEQHGDAGVLLEGRQLSWPVTCDRDIWIVGPAG